MTGGDLSGRNDGASGAGGGGTGFEAWTALGMLVQLVVTDPARVSGARKLLDEDLLALDLACSRFRSDSELVRVGDVARGASGASVTVAVSPLLAEAVAVALRAARVTDGDVDPTVGGALADLGYDRDFAEVAKAGEAAAADADGDAGERGAGHGAGEGGSVGVRVIPGWRAVSVDVGAGRLTVPAGVELDLGATVKGWAADRAAGRIAGELGCGVLVSLGGDTAVAGEAPGDGWRIRVQDRTGLPGEPARGLARW